MGCKQPNFRIVSETFPGNCGLFHLFGCLCDAVLVFTILLNSVEYLACKWKTLMYKCIKITFGKDLKLMLQGNHCPWPITLRPIHGGRWRGGEKYVVFLLSSSDIPLKSDYNTVQVQRTRRSWGLTLNGSSCVPFTCPQFSKMKTSTKNYASILKLLKIIII